MLPIYQAACYRRDARVADVDAHNLTVPDMKRHGLPGALITVDGIDGSGKSTVVAEMHAVLTDLGINFRQAKLPSPACRSLPYIASYIRDHRQTERGEVDLLSLCLVFNGDSLLSIRQEVLPELERGTWIVCDRYVFGGMAELIANRRPAREVEILAEVQSAFPQPDLAILTDIDAGESARRIHERPDERDVPIDPDLWGRFVDGYRAVGRLRGMHVADTSRPLDRLLAEVRDLVVALDRRKREAVTAGS